MGVPPALVMVPAMVASTLAVVAGAGGRVRRTGTAHAADPPANTSIPLNAAVAAARHPMPRRRWVTVPTSSLSSSPRSVHRLRRLHRSDHSSIGSGGEYSRMRERSGGPADGAQPASVEGSDRHTPLSLFGRHG